MTPLAKAAYEEACEEQAAWADKHGIKSNEDWERVVNSEGRADVIGVLYYLASLKERLAQAKEPERNAR